MSKKLSLEEREKFREIINELRSCNVDKSKRQHNKLREFIEQLSAIGVSYNKKYPKLVADNITYGFKIPNSPETLAEAMIWKLGKWEAYKNFIGNYTKYKNNPNSPVTIEGGIVFSAFAKHLADPVNSPIYDQHSLRGLWAICSFTYEENNLIDRLLKGKDNKLGAIDGNKVDLESSYALFHRKINAICKINSVTNQDLDQLLMPLGQALKKNFTRNELLKIINFET